MISIKNLSLEYDKGFRLFIENLIVREGEILAIIGPNGAGKTTLLNIIAMFDNPNKGSVEVFGQNILDGIDKLVLRRKMSFVFSQPYLLNETVYDNIALPLKLRRKCANERVEEMLGFFKITHLRKHNASALSQGQRHRVALARAFVMEPKLILLDEPFLSLDKNFKESIIYDLRKVIKHNKITVVFVTQDQTEALNIADTIAVMKDGRILQQDTPENVFNKPALKEVADFVGVETIISGEVIKKEGNLCFVKVSDSVLEAVSEYGTGDNVFVCIRPENVTVSTQSEKNSARNHFSAKIDQILLWGLKYRLSLNCGFTLTAFVTKQSIENLNLRAGGEVFVSFKATALHLIKR